MTDFRFLRCKAILEEVMKSGDPNCTVLAIVLDELLDDYKKLNPEVVQS